MSEVEAASPPHACESMAWAISDSVPLDYYDKLREYGIQIQDGGSSFLELKFCPFCGEKLPTSLREEWIRRLESLGIDDWLDPSIPQDMSTGAWWRNDPSLSSASSM